MKELNFQIKSLFIRRINKWYKNNKREFAWRSTSNPYFITIAEVLLQKTDAQKVVPIYELMSDKYRNPAFLADENIDNLRYSLKDIGLLNRAETLIRVGSFFYSARPQNVTFEKLIEIKGIGMYIANAVIIHTQNKRLPLLDPNIIRIYSRIYNLKSDVKRPRTDKALWDRSKSLMPKKNISDYYCALLDFGALVCKLKPLCSDCCMKLNMCFYFNSLN